MLLAVSLPLSSSFSEEELPPYRLAVDSRLLGLEGVRVRG